MSDDILTKECNHHVDEFFNARMAGNCPLCEIERLRGNLSLTEEGLANATQELAQRDRQLKESVDHEAAYQREIERLRAECMRLLARGDKAELELNALKTHYARRAAAEPGARQGEWQPIDTCPKDGNAFLAGRWNRDQTYWWVFKVHWANGVVDGGWGGAREPVEWPCTHWMPLPGPPSATPPHTTEDDYQHFLSYSRKRGVPHEADLRLAYYAALGAELPAHEGGQRGLQADTKAATTAEPVSDDGRFDSAPPSTLKSGERSHG